MKQRKRGLLILFSGAVWFCIGASLLFKGLRFLVFSVDSEVNYLDHKNSVVLLVSIALLLGFIKGRFVLMKSVQRIVKRILDLPHPVPFLKVYSPSYLFIILLMMSLGILMKIFHVPTLIRGFIDVAVGSALLFGSLAFLRVFFALKAKSYL